MANDKGRGSIIYEVLIVVLAVVLIASIIYPKKVTEQEEQNTALCRARMSSVFDAELQYQKYNDVYSDTLSKVIDFIKTNEQYSTYMDSVIKGGLDSIVTKLNEFLVEQQVIVDNIPMELDTVMADSVMKMQQSVKMASRRLAGYVEYIHDKMRNLPNTPDEELRNAFKVVDSKKFTLDMDIVRNSIENERFADAKSAAEEVLVTINSVKDMFQIVLDKLPEFKQGGIDSLKYCPSVHQPYKLAYIDTSTIKYLNIYCPVDSMDIQVIQGNFLKSKIGGLELKNHGKIESGEKSWESG